MAYIDQDRSREKTISGAISLAVIGVVGYGLVSGLAMRIVREKPWSIPTEQWKHPLPPIQKQEPQKRIDKTVRPMPQTQRQEIPRKDIPPIETAQTDMGPVKIIDTGTVGPTTIDLPPLQPTAVDHSSGASPKGRPGDWVSSEDYPASAVRAGIEGRTGFRLDVNADGRPTACTIVSSSGSAQLDRAACSKLIAKARFTPAHDAAGNAVASSYSNGVNWKLPATE